MSFSEPPVNPYQSPTDAGGLPPPTFQARSLEHFQLLKQFRQQIHALGGFWIFIAFVVLAASVVLIAAADGGNAFGRLGNSRLLIVISAVSGVIWLTLGVAACFKKLWAVYIGLGLSYLSVLGNLINLNLCALVILAVVIIQAHRVLGFAKRLRWLGIPLTARPEQLTMQVAPPSGQWPV